MSRTTVKRDQRTTVFAPDDEYDLQHASDFSSRYGAYLRQNVDLFVDDFGDLTRDRFEFAAAAWRIAQAPAMSPPYVTAHQRVLDTDSVWDLDGEMAVVVDVALDVPQMLSSALPGRWVGRSPREGWAIPESQDRIVAVASTQFRIPMSPDGLPGPRYIAGEPDTKRAKQAVHVLCGRLNSLLGRAFTRFGHWAVL